MRPIRFAQTQAAAAALVAKKTGHLGAASTGGLLYRINSRNRDSARVPAQNSSPEGLSVPMIARTATFARHQSGWTFNGKRTTQTINLASSQTQQPARSLNRQTIV